MNKIWYTFWSLQIIAESLPISSSSHVKLLEFYLKKKSSYKYFPNITEPLEHLMHAPTMLILITFLYFHISNLFLNFNTIMLWIITIFTANFITGVFYYLFNKIGKSWFPISLGLVITMLSLFSLYWVPVGIHNTITLNQALVIGFAQGIALLPGISRLALTYVFAKWLLISSDTAFLFSLILELFLISAALLKAFLNRKARKKFKKLLNNIYITSIIIAVIIGYLGLLLSYWLALNSMLYYVGWYMIIPLLFLYFSCHMGENISNKKIEIGGQ